MRQTSTLGRVEAAARRLTVAAWAAILGGATTLISLATIALRPAWRDEEFTRWVTQLSPHDFLDLVIGRRDAVHAAYYLVVRASTGVLGDSWLALRLPSAVLMGVACAWVVAIGAHWRSRRLAVTAGVVFALLPIVTRYGTEARPGAMTVACVTWATWAAAQLVDSPGPRRAVAYGALLVASAYAFVYSVLIALVHLIPTAAVAARRRAVRLLLAAQAVAAILVLPLALLGWRQQGQGRWLGDPGIRSAIQVATLPFGHGDRPATLALAAASWALVAVMTVAWLRRTPPADRGARDARDEWFLLMSWLWALLPGAVLISMSLVKPIFTSRYVLYSVPAVALLLAWAFDRLPGRIPKAVTASAFLALVALALPTAFVNHGDL